MTDTPVRARGLVALGAILSLGACAAADQVAAPSVAGTADSRPSLGLLAGETLSSVLIEYTRVGLDVGESLQLSTRLLYSQGSNLSGDSYVTWRSLDPTRVSVSTAGLARAVAGGATGIVATYEGLADTSWLAVAPTTGTMMVVAPNGSSVTRGLPVELVAAVRNSTGKLERARSIKWEAPYAVTTGYVRSGVEYGTMTPTADGPTTVRATASAVSATASLTVVAPASGGTTEPAPTPPPTTTAPAAAWTGSAELPRHTVDTRMPVTSRVVSVPAGANLQTAINNAQRGDVLALAPGATYTGNFTLPAKAGDGWIVIRTGSTDAQIPAAGRRVTPATAATLAKIVSPNGMPAIATSGVANRYRITGVEVTASTAVTSMTSLISFGASGTAQNTLASVPQHLVLDRVYAHGHGALTLKRCLTLNSAWSAVVDSYLSECHGQGMDTQAILGWNGPGPFRIVNNYLEGAGENVMFGGADPSISGLIPSDIEVRGNHFFKPLAWKGRWTVKNVFELKVASRVLVEGNVLENSWADGQVGFAFVFKSTNQNGGCSWCTTSDVTVRGNLVVNVGGGVAISGGENIVTQTNDIVIQNNVFRQVLEANGVGRVFQVTGPVEAITIDHNTGDSDYTALTVSSVPKPITFTNNLLNYGKYGASGTSSMVGFAPVRNLFFGPAARALAGDNYAVLSTDLVGFANYAGGDWSLLSSSPFITSGTDGRPLGALFTSVMSGTSTVR